MLSLNEGINLPGGGQVVDLVRLDDALTSLAAFDEQQSRIIELRFFGGLSIQETAQETGGADLAGDPKGPRDVLFGDGESVGGAP